MKTFRLLLILGLSFTLASCPNDDEPDEDNNIPGVLMAKINGETVDFSQDPTAYFGLSNDEEALFIRGSSPDYSH